MRELLFVVEFFQMRVQIKKFLQGLPSRPFGNGLVINGPKKLTVGALSARTAQGAKVLAKVSVSRISDILPTNVAHYVRPRVTFAHTVRASCPRKQEQEQEQDGK